MATYDKSMPVMPDEPLESEEKSQLISLVSTTVKFSQNIVGLEIANNSSSATIYIKIDGTIATLNSGIPIYSKTYYSADKLILKDTGISLISDTVNTDVRIIGHFLLTSENDGNI